MRKIIILPLCFVLIFYNLNCVIDNIDNNIDPITTVNATIVYCTELQLQDSTIVPLLDSIMQFEYQRCFKGALHWSLKMEQGQKDSVFLLFTQVTGVYMEQYPPKIVGYLSIGGFAIYVEGWFDKNLFKEKKNGIRSSYCLEYMDIDDMLFLDFSAWQFVFADNKITLQASYPLPCDKE